MQITNSPTRAVREDWERAEEGTETESRESKSARVCARPRLFVASLSAGICRNHAAVGTVLPGGSHRDSCDQRTWRRHAPTSAFKPCFPRHTLRHTASHICHTGMSSLGFGMSCTGWLAAHPSGPSLRGPPLEGATTFCTYREVCVYFLAIYDNSSSQPISPASSPSPRVERTVSSCCRSPRSTLLASSPDCLSKSPAICHSTMCPMTPCQLPLTRTP